jgi:hypothetical protein
LADAVKRWLGESLISEASLHCPINLCGQMTVGRMVESLEAPHFDKREQASLVPDLGVQAFLIRATKAAAADHLDAKVRHLWRGIKRPR